jgi:hypothetical protein
VEKKKISFFSRFFLVKKNSKSPEFYNRELFLPSSKITKGFLILFIFTFIPGLKPNLAKYSYG